MHPIIEAKKPEIIELFRQYGVIKLDLFGSATGPDWNPETSDFDFVVEFGDYGPCVSTRFFDFGDNLETLLGREVDFVFEQRLRSRFRRNVDATREVVLG